MYHPLFNGFDIERPNLTPLLTAELDLLFRRQISITITPCELLKFEEPAEGLLRLIPLAPD